MREMSPDEEFDAVRKAAHDLGFFAQVHRNFDPLSDSGGPWYLQRKKNQRRDHEPTILKYQTADQIFAWLDEYAKSVQR